VGKKTRNNKSDGTKKKVEMDEEIKFIEYVKHLSMLKINMKVLVG
jgi:hypothetical protein